MLEKQEAGNLFRISRKFEDITFIILI